MSFVNKLSDKQRNLLVEWYNNNFEKANDMFFDCETFIDNKTFLKILNINRFDNICLAINDFIINVLSKGK